MEVWGVFFCGGGLEVKQITKMLRFFAMKNMENQKRPTNTNNNVIVVISNNPHKNREINNIKQPCY